MNIQTAASYARHGYRIRRAKWEPDRMIGKSSGFFWHCYYIKSDGRRLSVSCSWLPDIDDVVADDWELVLDGIATDYGTVKYEDKK